MMVLLSPCVVLSIRLLVAQTCLFLGLTDVLTVVSCPSHVLCSAYVLVPVSLPHPPLQMPDPFGWLSLQAIYYYYRDRQKNAKNSTA